MNKKITDYMVVSLADATATGESVTAKLAQGWHLFGALASSNSASGRVAYSQPMVKYEENDTSAAKKEIQYVQGENLAELAGKVEECLKEKWEPLGTLVIAPDNKRFYQAMSR